jgi:archaellum component FlaC
MSDDGWSAMTRDQLLFELHLMRRRNRDIENVVESMKRRETTIVAELHEVGDRYLAYSDKLRYYRRTVEHLEQRVHELEEIIRAAG